MKIILKFILLFTIILSFNFSAFAQYYTKVGIRATTNLCGLWGPGKPQDYNKLWGYGAGTFFTFPIADNFSSIVELNYSRRIFSFSEPLYLIDNSLLTVKETNDFITVPIMLKLKKGDDFTSINVTFGWQASFLLKNQKEITAKIGQYEVPYDVYYNFTNGFYDYGFALGTGFQIKAVWVDLRYYMSMRNIHEGDNAREMRFTTINLSLGYQINYSPPRVFRKNTAIRELKYKLKHIFK